MSQVILIVLVALIIGILYLIKLRNFDIYDKEPFGTLFLSFAVGGVVSIIVTTQLYRFVEVELTFSQAFYKVGLIEELAKLFTFFLIYRIIKKHFDEIVDGIIYMSAIALGFAVIENMSYALGSDQPFLILGMRAFTSTIGHMAFSGIMGVALFIHFRVRTNWWGILVSLLIAAFAHGFYDGVLFNPDYNWSFLPVYLIIVFAALWLIRIVLSFSRFRQVFSLQLFIESNQGSTQICLNCNESTTGTILTFWKVDTQECGNCQNLVFDFSHWKRLNRYYLPLRKWKNILKTYKNSPENIVHFGYQKEHVADLKRERVTVQVNVLSQWFETENKNDKIAMLNKPIIGWLLKGIGLRFMLK